MKHAKKAFLASLLSTLLCVTMLIGTTFAWFTDSVTSGGNKIVSGTLDIALYQYDSTSGGYVDISNSTAPIFGGETSTVAQNNNSDTLWEPGKTQVAYLQLRNEGNLHLKYQVALKVTNPTDGKDLYKALRYEIIPDAVASEVTSWTGPGLEVVPGTQVVSGSNTTDTYPGVKMAPGDIHSFALAVHMLETSGNEYQDGKVEFDLTVVATQQTAEEDSFDNQYDKDALTPFDVDAAAINSTTGKTLAPAGTVTVTNSAATSLVASETVITDDSATSTIPADTAVTLTGYTEPASGTDEMTGITRKIATNDATSNAITYDISYTATVTTTTGTGTSTEEYEVHTFGNVVTNVLEIGRGLAGVAVTHGGTPMTKLDTNTATDGGYYYDSATGKLYIYSSTYSPFVVTWVEPEMAVTASGEVYGMSLVEFRDAWNAGELPAGVSVKLMKDVDISALSWEPIGNKTRPFIGTFDGNGKTVTGMTNGDYHGESTPNTTTAIIGETYGFFGYTAGTVEIKDLTLSNISVDYENAKVCGGLIGNTDAGSGMDSLKITGVNVSGNIKGYDKVAGLVGYLLNVKAVDVENCTVAGTLSLTDYGTTKGYRAGGLFGYVSCATGSTGLVKDCTVSATLSKGDSTATKRWIGAISSGYNSQIDMDIVNFKYTGPTIADHNLIPTLAHDKFSGHGDRYTEFIDILGENDLPLFGLYGKIEMSNYRESYNGFEPPSSAVLEDLRGTESNPKSYHLTTAPAADGSYTFKVHAAIFTVSFTNPGDSITIVISGDLQNSRYVQIATGEMATAANNQPHDHSNWDWIMDGSEHLNISTYGSYYNLLYQMLQTNVIKTVD